MNVVNMLSTIVNTILGNAHNMSICEYHEHCVDTKIVLCCTYRVVGICECCGVRTVTQIIMLLSSKWYISNDYWYCDNTVCCLRYDRRYFQNIAHTYVAA